MKIWLRKKHVLSCNLGGVQTEEPLDEGGLFATPKELPLRCGALWGGTQSGYATTIEKHLFITTYLFGYDHDYKLLWDIFAR